MGPMVSDVQQQRVAGFIDSGLAEGATATAGGRKHEGRGYFVQPTVLTNVNNRMRVAQEEIFGPVLVAQPFETIDELITKANDTQYGLACAVWTKDINKANRVAQAVRAGSIYVNCHSVVDPAMPFGGFKQSGWGRELGTDSIDAYLETKAVCTLLA